MAAKKKNGSGKIDRSRVHGEAFDNIAEFYSYLDNGTTQPAFEGRSYGLASQKEGEDALQFTSTATYNDATNLLLYGDYDSSKRVADNGVTAQLKKPQRDERRRTRVLGPCGFLPHVPNYVAGRPNCMISERVKLQRKNVVTVAYNICANCDITAEDMQNAASDVLASVLKCERQGVRVNLYAVSVSADNEHYCALAIKIKDSAQHLDLLKMAYPLTHPSMLRRHEFRFTEVIPGLPDTFACGYGRSVYDAKKTRDVLECLGVKTDAVLTYGDVRYMTHQQIVDTITGQQD